MKRVTILLLALIAGIFAMSAQPTKGPARSSIYRVLPYNFTGLGTFDNPNHLYYSTQEQQAIPIGALNSSSYNPSNYVNGVSIIGEIEGRYYSSTYAKLGNTTDTLTNPGAGFIAAMKVDNSSAVICNSSESGTTSNSVRFTARVERAGEYAARIIYTLKNNATEWLFDDGYRTVSLGVWADIMIGDNDSAAIYCLRNEQGQVYGLDMKYKQDELAEPGEKVPVFTAIFDGASGVTPVDDWWFGQYTDNCKADEIIGNYSKVSYIYNSNNQWVKGTEEDPFYKVEGGHYDSAMGFCWKNITLAAGESVELSFLVSVSEIDIDEPEPDPEAEYHVEVYDCPEWNDLPADHPARVWGYYKHPFDWTGHMEYSVDGGEWTAIPGELAPNSNFDLSFNLNFDPDVDDIHTLKLRLVDVEGNPTYLDELDQEWEDVRTIDMTVNPETQAYDGTAKTFVVTLGGVIDYPVEYTEPGKYEFPIYGEYEMQTIGVNTVYFYIKYQPELNVVVPEDCVYDGEEHAATYTYNGDGDVIVTYKDSEGNISTDAPVEPGTYEVFVEVTETENYLGIDNASYGSFTISKIEPELIVIVPDDCVYDGNEHPATVIYNGDGDVIVTYVPANRAVSNEGPVEPGTYAVFVEVTEGEHYAGIEKKKYGEFTISKIKGEVNVTLPEDCVYDGEAHGATATVTVGDGEATVTYVNTKTGETSTEAPVNAGTYEVFVELTSTEYYEGFEATSYGTFTIDKAQSVVKVIVPEDCVYDGNTHPATVTLEVGDGEMTVVYSKDNVITTEDPKEVGTYYVVVTVEETENYYGIETTMYGPFRITNADPSSAINELNVYGEDDGAWYTIDGRRVAAPTQSGLYIHNGKKYYIVK